MTKIDLIGGHVCQFKTCTMRAVCCSAVGLVGGGRGGGFYLLIREILTMKLAIALILCASSRARNKQRRLQEQEPPKGCCSTIQASREPVGGSEEPALRPRSQASRPESFKFQY